MNTFESNIKQVWLLATNNERKTDWYIEANKFATTLSNEFNVPLYKVCGIIASLSPLKSWSENKRIVKKFLSIVTNDATTEIVGLHTKLLVTKALNILHKATTIDDVAKFLNGDKITSFFYNILHPKMKTRVTIDRHAISVAHYTNLHLRPINVPKGDAYKLYEQAYVNVANELNIRPQDLQSSTWLAYKRLKKKNNEQPIHLF